MVQGSLSTYNRKRDFRGTPEPSGKSAGTRGAGMFVVQKHAASRLHYDFRLEWDGVLLSWAVPKGPSLDPALKRMAVQTEDHPLSYGDFEGIIPEGHYGAGSVVLWDTGRWTPVGDAARGMRDGKLKFTLDGHKLKGGFTLVRLRPRGNERQSSWLLIKERDAHARPVQEFDVLTEMAESVKGQARQGRPAKRAKPKAKAKAKAKAKSKSKAKSKAKSTQKSKAKSASPSRRSGEPLPPLLAPQLATLVTAPPAGGEWMYELKLDGYRLLVRIEGADVRCFTRNGNDWTDRTQRIVKAMQALDLPDCWLDGELVALDPQGVPDFQRLQNSFERRAAAELRFVVFDLLFQGGEDLRGLPQRERSERLAELLEPAREAKSIIQLSPPLEGDPAELLAASRAAGFEGLVGKRVDGTYRSGRSSDWIKLKAGLRQEFVIGGFTDPQGSRTGLGSLLLGVHDEQGKLRYAGNVGTGFDEDTLRTLHAKLSAIETSESPFVEGPKRVGTKRLAVPHWVKPKLVAEVSFAGWTEGKNVRHAVFHGLREDKPARQITRERAGKPASRSRAADAKPATRARTAAAKPATRSRAKRPAPALPDGLRVTHPERVIDAQSGITKGELVAYYAAVAELMQPHLEGRPVAMLRAPNGVDGQQFFQKHANEGTLRGLERLPKSLDPDHRPLLVIPGPKGLLSAAQMNVVEVHTWNATRRAIEKPDRLIFDLDPGEGVEWKQVAEAAVLTRALLDELELKSFLKTSGGKGLHIVLPLKPALGWDDSKEFSAQVVRHLARVLPQRFVAKSGPSNRVARIFADFLRNGRGATTVSAWSARARPGMGISVPIRWDELPELTTRPQWNVVDYGDRLRIGNAPWKDYEASRQTLARAIKALAAIERPARKSKGK